MLPHQQGSIGTVLARAEERLRLAGVESWYLDSLVLLAKAMGLDKATLLAHPELPLAPEQQATYESLLARREGREPLAYIVAEREFYGRSFLVTRSTLVPRPETEMLVELGLRAAERQRRVGRTRPLVADVGVGSGAVAVSLALEAPWTRIVGVDISLDALRVARDNVRRWQVEDRVGLVAGDVLSPLGSEFHIIIGNLPYIASGQVESLMPEVSRHEPRVALDGGLDGTEMNLRLLGQAATKLAEAGELLLEMGSGQGAVLARRAQRVFPTGHVDVLRDAARRQRVLHVTLGQEGPTLRGRGVERMRKWVPNR